MKLIKASLLSLAIIIASSAFADFSIADETNRNVLFARSGSGGGAALFRKPYPIQKRSYPKAKAGSRTSGVQVRRISRVPSDIRRSNVFLGLHERATRVLSEQTSPEVIFATTYIYSDAQR